MDDDEENQEPERYLSPALRAELAKWPPMPPYQDSAGGLTPTPLRAYSPAQQLLLNASDMRPDLTSYLVCLGCSQPLTEPREHRTGLHDRCEPGYRIEARFVWPGEEWSLDRMGRFACGGCGGLFIAHAKDTEAEFKARVAAWAQRHGRHAPRAA